MEVKAIMYDSQKFIEDNMKESLTVEEIASNVGYSVYYFSRIFKQYMKESVMEYVKERKLIKASEEIIAGKKILDVALEYGYQSHSGFTKAFKKTYGFSPILLRAFNFQKNYLGGNYIMSHAFMSNTNVHATKEELFEVLVSTVLGNQLKCNQEELQKAFDMACLAHEGQIRHSGDEYVCHSINVAILLADMEATQDTIIAGLLHDVLLEKTNITLTNIEKEFSNKVSNIVDGVTRFNNEKVELSEEAVLVKLADRLHNMRTLEFMDKSRWNEKAKETIDIFMPIAINLGNEKLKAELNDLSIKYIGR
ncbi:helix-turn-helix transcriptional regulator [[Clostridium] fimetarium]|uniref:GTP pyrophosphokinase n=1 Tax=[Clostridium] fimetarium TaxID=99656 RepID=A0A1I0PG34_9FIRM|nr:helix-turn-helix transcriptional regulator [[Clostridium] fimetarium]SEW13411.1 GTP pyrophosphokinase [[Clostridium] fimetarium]